MSNSSPNNPSKPLVCAFCGRPSVLVHRLVAGPDGVNICDECVSACVGLINTLDAKEADAGHPARPPLVPPASASAAATPPAGKRQPVDASEPAAAASSGAPTISDAGKPRADGAHVKPVTLIPPEQIHAVLDDFVIGQNQAKKVLSVAVYNHYKRLNSRLHKQALPEGVGDGLEGVEVEKSNILLLGPTGSGKTLLARTLARTLDVPFAIADATTVTEAGYVGEDVESIVQRLLAAANFDPRRAETGIIYIDEIDKLALKGDSPHVSRNLGQGVQHALLKIVEGCMCNVPPQGGRKHPEQQYVQVDTENILFICGGAFVGLDEIIGRRIGKKFLGFDVTAEHPGGEPLTAEQIMEHLQPEDLFNFGLIPEFVGRLPIASALSELKQADLERVLVEPKNSLTRQFRKLFAMEGVKLTFTPDGLSAIAKKALELKTGARGLRSIIERLMLDTMYRLPGNKTAKEVIVNEAVVNGGQPAIIRE